jgi:glycosyltransferase involved in cell wall biosynthesis
MPNENYSTSSLEHSIAVLTDHGDPRYFNGVRVRIDPQGLESTGKLSSLPGLRYLRNVFKGCAMYWRAARWQGPAVVVTFGSTAGFILAYLQYLFRVFKTPKVHVMFDLLLDAKRSGLAGIADSAKAWIFNRSISGAAIWGKSDIARYEGTHGYNSQKLFFHPYHTTLDNIPEELLENTDGDYIFCGGNVGRDFASVIRALGPLGYKTFIATQVPGMAALATEFPHITVQGVTPLKFRQLIAGCTFVVETHPREFFRTAGHQTMLNAMLLGKALILADTESAAGYVREGINGFVLEAEDVEGLQSTARRLWEDTKLRERLAARGRKIANHTIYRTLNHMQSIYNHAVRLYARQHNRSFKDYRITMYK